MGKYQTWNSAEDAPAAAGAAQAVLVNDLADDDTTIVMAIAEIVATANTYSNGTVVGVARLVISRAGQDASGSVTRSAAVFDRTVAGTVNDADKGDTWAMAPIVVNGGSVTHVKLAPNTKRKLRKGDQVLLTVDGINDADAAISVTYVGTLTLFTAEQ